MEAQSTQEGQKSARLTLHPIMLSEAISMKQEKRLCIVLHSTASVEWHPKGDETVPFFCFLCIFSPFQGC